MQLLVSRAGLALNPGQVADLVLAWRQVASLIARLPHDRPLQDDFAYVFRLPPPGDKPPPRAKPAPPAKPAAPRAKAKPAAPAKPAAKGKRPPPPPKRKAAPAKKARRAR